MKLIHLVAPPAVREFSNLRLAGVVALECSPVRLAAKTDSGLDVVDHRRTTSRTVDPLRRAPAERSSSLQRPIVVVEQRYRADRLPESSSS